MKKYLPLLVLAFSCTRPTSNPSELIADENMPLRQEVPAFQTILDSAELKGVILILDATRNTFLSNDFQWAAKGQLPASTFKIPNSLIALETGVVANDSTFFKWDGQPRWSKSWEQDLIFKEAFQLSCVPCYQEIARKIGPERMNTYLDRFDYGRMQVDSTNIDLFWLEGTSRITPFQQIDFLKRFFEEKLPISKRTYQLMKKIMILEEQEGYRLSGKTGWSTRGEVDNGWFVGFVEKEGNVHYFATNIEPKPAFNMDQFPSIRKEATMKALKKLGVIDQI